LFLQLIDTRIQGFDRVGQLFDIALSAALDNPRVNVRADENDYHETKSHQCKEFQSSPRAYCA
jgi:hypothetical protein